MVVIIRRGVSAEKTQQGVPPAAKILLLPTNNNNGAETLAIRLERVCSLCIYFLLITLVC